MKATSSTDELQKMFYGWLEGEPTGLPFSVMQTALAQMEANMPTDFCLRHGFPPGCSVGHAARSSIVLCGNGGIEHRLDVVIDFRDEDESRVWWQNNRDNPDRVVVEPGADGGHVLRIAPIDPGSAK